MKRSIVAAAVATVLGLAGCGQGSTAETADDTDAVATTDASTAAPAAPSIAAEAPPPAPAGVPAAPGAPEFAVLYPGGEVQGEPTVAGGPSGDGGLVTFRTDASPEDVVAFYRQHAEQAGLGSVMAMNQGDARAYGARATEIDGANLSVVASPVEDGGTSVQLSWSEGA